MRPRLGRASGIVERSDTLLELRDAKRVILRRRADRRRDRLALPPTVGGELRSSWRSQASPSERLSAQSRMNECRRLPDRRRRGSAPHVRRLSVAVHPTTVTAVLRAPVLVHPPHARTECATMHGYRVTHDAGDVAAASKVAPSHPAALMRASLVAPLGRPMREPLRPVGPASSPSSDRMATRVEEGGSDVPLFFRELLDLSSLVRFKRYAFRLRAPKVKRPASPR